MLLRRFHYVEIYIEYRYEAFKKKKKRFNSISQKAIEKKCCFGTDIKLRSNTKTSQMISRLMNDCLFLFDILFNMTKTKLSNLNMKYLTVTQ